MYIVLKIIDNTTGNSIVCFHSNFYCFKSKNTLADRLAMNSSWTGRDIKEAFRKNKFDTSKDSTIELDSENSSYDNFMRNSSSPLSSSPLNRSEIFFM